MLNVLRFWSGLTCAQFAVYHVIDFLSSAVGFEGDLQDVVALGSGVHDQILVLAVLYVLTSTEFLTVLYVLTASEFEGDLQILAVLGSGARDQFLV